MDSFPQSGCITTTIKLVRAMADQLGLSTNFERDDIVTVKAGLHGYVFVPYWECIVD